MSRKSIMPNIAYDTLRRSFYVTMRARSPQDGAIRRVTRCYPTLERAVAALDSFNAGKLLSRSGSGDKLTVGQWLSYWLEQVVPPSRTASTTHGYTMIVRNHLSPALGRVKLRELTAPQIQLYLRRKQAEGLSSNTVRKHLGVLHNALEQARRQDLISRNEAGQVTPPASTRPDHHFYDSHTMGLLFEALSGTSLEPVVKLAGYLGLRRSEVLGLRWRDVDLQTGLLSVRWVRTTVGYRVVEKTPKTADSCRTLSIGALDGLLDLLQALRTQRRWDGLPCGPDDYLVLNPEGVPWHPNVLSADLADFVAQRRLPPITFHGLRHTFASMANSARVPMYQISRAMGHANPSITQRIYTHLFDQTHGEVLAAVANVVEGSFST